MTACIDYLYCVLDSECISLALRVRTENTEIQQLAYSCTTITVFGVIVSQCSSCPCGTCMRFRICWCVRYDISVLAIVSLLLYRTCKYILIIFLACNTCFSLPCLMHLTSVFTLFRCGPLRRETYIRSTRRATLFSSIIRSIFL